MSSATTDPELLSGPTTPPMVVIDMVWPDQSNHHGTLFGGAALSMLDRLAFIVGSKALRGSVVTASVSDLNFAAPAPAGHLVECSAQVLRQGKRSVTVGTRLVAEDLLSGTRTECLSGEFVMVRQAETTATAAASTPPVPAQAPYPSKPPVFTDSGKASAMVAEIVFPGHANHRGMLHGGPAMEWMAKAGFAAATRRMRRAIVMASSEKLDFKAPAHVGDVVEVTATVIATGRRSIHVHVDMWAESPTTGERRHCTTGTLVFVAVA
ncbi:acyl-CoA thioesterase [Hylemonella sp. W303a]|uniref:acyl-CoA thioesterase n=1 Tax=Hylemonella sp. W303a TaxID=3389873 RepID=UPI00396B211D